MAVIMERGESCDAHERRLKDDSVDLDGVKWCEQKEERIVWDRICVSGFRNIEFLK